MDTEEFRVRGKEMIDFIADYLETVNKRKVTADVEPGYLRNLIPLQPPESRENWDQIMKDVEDKIMPGITHWQHPDFHAYFPAGNSYPSILGDLLSSGLGIVGFSWASSPACTELETIIMQWLGKMSGLPAHLLPFKESNSFENLVIYDQNMNRSERINHQESDSNEKDKNVQKSGGVLLGSASECVFVSMLSARNRAIDRYKATFNSEEEDGMILTKLVAYTSKLAHSCVRKAAMISMVKVRFIEYDHDQSMRGETLEKAIQADLEQGLIPFYVCGTFGTTSCCSFDNVVEIGQVCQKYDIYLHVDSAYAGNALICEEFRYLMRGLEYVDSLNYNPNKWMLVNFDCSCLWVKNNDYLIKALSVDPVYLRYDNMEKTIDYRNWGIALSRRFRSLKLWFTIRSYGVRGLQDYIREHVRLAKEFERMVRTDNRFEIFGQANLGLVCFRLKGPNILTQRLLERLLDFIHMTKDIVNQQYIIRFCVNAKKATLEDIERAWQMISSEADRTILEYEAEETELNRLKSCQDGLLSFRECTYSILYIKKSMRNKTITSLLCEPTKQITED